MRLRKLQMFLFEVYQLKFGILQSFVAIGTFVLAEEIQK